ncbi:dephospho-CoA kinase [Paucibacter soli]|uniref:dephospho-CoA kinase n=1 Tax=Paucibacter soli TaxID=3133433 RepID=UPI0030B097F2
MRGRALRIGLTGGIGSGKSTVALAWIEAGADVIDTDAISRALTAVGGAAMPAIVQAFGAQAAGPDGALDRANMRALAFRDEPARRRLEAILHPMISVETSRRAEASTADLLVFDVPLLVESGRWRSRVQRVLVVDCEEQTQVERVMQRSGWQREAVLAVIAQQASRAARRAVADAVLYNDGINADALRMQVLSLAAHWRRG